MSSLHAAKVIKTLSQSLRSARSINRQYRSQSSCRRTNSCTIGFAIPILRGRIAFSLYLLRLSNLSASILRHEFPKTANIISVRTLCPHLRRSHCSKRNARFNDGHTGNQRDEAARLRLRMNSFPADGVFDLLHSATYRFFGDWGLPELCDGKLDQGLGLLSGKRYDRDKRRAG